MQTNNFNETEVSITPFATRRDSSYFQRIAKMRGPDLSSLERQLEKLRTIEDGAASASLSRAAEAE